MRLLGVVLFIVGAAGAGYATWATFHHKRPIDVAFGLLAPVAVTLALTGLVLAFVPGFLG